MNRYQPTRSGQVVVTTKSGLTMTLEAAGEDRDGNQLWRQVGSSPRPIVERIMRELGQ